MSGSKSKSSGGTSPAYGTGSGSRHTKSLAVKASGSKGAYAQDNNYLRQGDNLGASGYGEVVSSGRNEGSSSYNATGSNAIDIGRRLHVEKYWLPPSTTPPFCLPGGLPARGYQNPNQLTIAIDKSTINYPTPPPEAIPITTKTADIPNPCPNFPVYLNGMQINNNEADNSGTSGIVRPHFNNCAFYNFCCDAAGPGKVSKTSSSRLSTKTRSRKSSRPSSTAASSASPQDEGDAFDVGAKSSSEEKKKRERASKNLIFRDDEPSHHSSASQIESFKSLYYY